MVFAEHFNDYKKVIAKDQKINESHKKFYIIWVELFLKYLGEDNSVEDKLPKAEMLTNFTKYLYESNKYQEWQINQAITPKTLKNTRKTPKKIKKSTYPTSTHYPFHN